MTDFKRLNKIVIDDFGSFNSCYSSQGFFRGGGWGSPDSCWTALPWRVGGLEAALDRDQRDLWRCSSPFSPFPPHRHWRLPPVTEGQTKRRWGQACRQRWPSCGGIEGQTLPVSMATRGFPQEEAITGLALVGMSPIHWLGSHGQNYLQSDLSKHQAHVPFLPNVI